MKQTKKYYFFYTVKNDNSEKAFIYDTKKCKQPEKTVLYKKLSTWFDIGLVETFGYSTTTQNIDNLITY